MYTKFQYNRIKINSTISSISKVIAVKPAQRRYDVTLSACMRVTQNTHLVLLEILSVKRNTSFTTVDSMT
jgi:hypothetical protein